MRIKGVKIRKVAVQCCIVLLIICSSIVASAYAAALTINDPNMKNNRRVNGLFNGQWHQYTVTTILPFGPLSGMMPQDQTVLNGNFAGWTIDTTFMSVDLPGELLVQKYDAAVKSIAGWDPSDPMRIDYASGGGFPPADWDLRWVQFIDTNVAIQNEPTPHLDPTWWDKDGGGPLPVQRDFEDGLPFYWNPQELNANMNPGGIAGLRFEDRPGRGLGYATPGNPVQWRARLYLVLWDANKTIRVYGNSGLEWGFWIFAERIAARKPGPLRYLQGGVAGDKFDEIDLGINSTIGDGGIWVPVNKLGLVAPYVCVTSTILVATIATAIYVKHVKRRETKHT